MLKRVEVPQRFAVDSLRAFREMLSSLSASGQARAVILTGGAKVFSAGLDLQEALGPNGEALVFEAHRCFRDLAQFDLPVIAQVEGKAIAGGLIWAAWADVVVAGEHARFQLPEASFGLPPYFVIACLRQRLGPRALTRLAGGCADLDAANAMSIGLVDKVISAEKLAAAARAEAHALARPGRLAFQQIKAFSANDDPLPARLDAAAAKLKTAFQDADLRESVEAYAHATNLFADDAQSAEI